MTHALQQAINLHRAGQLDQAESLYRKILAQQPHHPEALHFLGVLLDNRGNHDEGIDLIQRAIRINPAATYYHNNLGEALRKAGRFEEAAAAYRQAISLRPDHPLTWYNLGLSLAEQKRFDEAVDAYYQALLLNPKFAEAYNNLAISLVALEKLEQAAAAYESAIQVAPTAHLSYINLAMLLARLKRLDQAIPLGEKARTLRPDYVETHYNLGLLYTDALRYADAIAAYLKVIEMNPGHALAHNNVGNLYREVGEPERALHYIRRSLQLNPDPTLQINLMTAMYHMPGESPAAIRQEHEHWAQHETASLTKFSSWENDPDPNRPLRIGYVSADFRQHSVAYFLEPILAHHHQKQFHSFCYSSTTKADEVTQRLKNDAHAWRDVAELSDDQLCEQIRADKIDILVDLAGHTTGTRLYVFARKPTPIQIAYLGYPNTTGVRQIDYRITDALADPVNATDAFYTEALLRIPAPFLCYRFPKNLPDVSPLPALETDAITFGSFNLISKINPQVAQLWARILAAVPRSRLLLKSHVLLDARTSDHVRQRLLENGIPNDRLELVARVKDHAEHLAIYSRIDIGLDPFPYNGTTTTCEAMTMGVPVIALAGDSHISRVGISLMTTVGLPHLVAQSPDEYVQIAATLAKDRAGLAAMRGSLRHRMKTSPLCDEPLAAQKVEAVYRQVWRHWTATKA